MKLALLASAAVGIFGIAWFWFVGAVLAEVESQRTDLAHEASPCRQEFGRFVQ